jgi:hypothetical protein
LLFMVVAPEDAGAAEEMVNHARQDLNGK